MFFGWAYAGLGETDRAFEWLAKIPVERSPQVNHIASLPLMAPLRRDPRFEQLLAELKLPV